MATHDVGRGRWLSAFTLRTWPDGLGHAREYRSRWSLARPADPAPSHDADGYSRRVPASRVRTQPRLSIVARSAAFERRVLLTEEIFRDVLVRESRRAERFVQPFVVLLIGLSDGTPRADAVWEQAGAGIVAATRETDIVGWVEAGRVLGVVLTEIAASEEAVARQAEERIREQLQSRLGSAIAGLSVRLHFRTTANPATGQSIWPDDPFLFEPMAQRQPAMADAPKRLLDVMGSAVLLAVLAPLFLVIASLVKMTSPGPVFFRQRRVGQKASPFMMLKFRSMHANADSKVHQQYVTEFIKSGGQAAKGSEQVFKLTNDSRITPLGHFLRKTSLDELPQLWNVLRGDMSLVGPRPPLFYETEQYQPWHWRRVLDAKPGVTGLWQVAGRSRTTFDGMVRLDLRYVRTRSLWTDLKILMATPAAVISGKGAC